MWLIIVEFALVTLGLKVAIGVFVIYALFPSDHHCPRCDEETLPLQASRGFAWLWRFFRVRRRWCPACGLEHMGREGRPVRVGIRSPGEEQEAGRPL